MNTKINWNNQTEVNAWALRQVEHYERLDAMKLEAIVRNYDTVLTVQQTLALLKIEA